MVGMMLRRNRKNKNNKNKEIIIESDDTFAFIAGYTSGGFPYGVTWEEIEQKSLEENDEVFEDDLPFD